MHACDGEELQLNKAEIKSSWYAICVCEKVGNIGAEKKKNFAKAAPISSVKDTKTRHIAALMTSSVPFLPIPSFYHRASPVWPIPLPPNK